jgi:hypothetical protein
VTKNILPHIHSYSFPPENNSVSIISNRAFSQFIVHCKVIISRFQSIYKTSHPIDVKFDFLLNYRLWKLQCPVTNAMVLLNWFAKLIRKIFRIFIFCGLLSIRFFTIGKIFEFPLYVLSETEKMPIKVDPWKIVNSQCPVTNALFFLRLWNWEWLSNSNSIFKKMFELLVYCVGSETLIQIELKRFYWRTKFL